MNDATYFINDANTILPFFIIETSVIYNTISNLIQKLSVFIVTISQILTLTVYALESLVTSIITDLFTYGQKELSRIYSNIFSDNNEQAFIIIAIIAFTLLFAYDKYTYMNIYHESLIKKINNLEYEIKILKKNEFHMEDYYECVLRKYNELSETIEDNELYISQQIKDLNKKMKKLDKKIKIYN